MASTEFGSHHPEPAQFTTNPKRFAQPGDLLFCVRGSTTGRMNWADQEYAIGRGIAAIRHKQEIGNQPYVWAVVEFCLPSLLAEATGSTFPNVSRNQLHDLQVPIAPIDEQKAIANILGSLDDKIELNRQMNATLEAIAQTLFKSWFVNFDPVIDNALAAGNPIPEPLQKRAEARKALGDQRKPLPDAIQKQFPNDFVFNDDMGWFPEEWEGRKFEHLAEVIMGQSPKGDTYNSEGDGMPLVNGPVEFGEYFTVKTKWTTAPTKIAAENDLIVCVRGSTTGRYVKSDDEYCLGRGVCAIRGRISQVFVDQTFKSKINALLQMTTGSTFPNWSGPTLKSFLVVMPSSNLLNLFDKQVAVAIQNIGSNVVQNRTLSNLRDSLLPKLLSGQLRIPEAEKRVAEVL